MDIRLEESGSGGRYVMVEDGADEPGEDPAVMTFSRASDTLIIVDSTYVPDRYRGQGVGGKLVDNLIADARDRGFKIVPLCPFVKAQFARHPEWQDVLNR